LFVAISMNLKQILASRTLPGRAAETLAMLGVLLVIALLGLVPGQPRTAFGIELVGCSVVAIVTATVAQVRGHDPAYDYRYSRVFFNQVPAALFAGAGIALLANVTPTPWLAAGAVAAFAGAVVNAWVLLVEILR
jgi:modulator of FtsH protease